VELHSDLADGNHRSILATLFDLRSPPVESLLRASKGTAYCLVTCAVLIVGVFALQHYRWSSLVYLSQPKLVIAYVTDHRVRALVRLIEHERQLEAADAFRTLVDAAPGVLVSGKMFRRIDADGLSTYGYKPLLQKVMFRTPFNVVRSGFELEDGPGVRTALDEIRPELLATASYDEHGFRRVEPVLTRNCATRALFLGDSFTDGMWVDDRDTFVDLFGHLVRERSSLQLCPTNAGVNGYGSSEEAYTLEHSYDAVGSPRIVFIMHFPNDVDADYDAVIHGAFADAKRKWAETLETLRRMNAYCRQRNATLVLVAIPAALQLSVPSTARNYQDVLRAFARSQEMPFIDLLPGLRASGRTDLYWTWDPHFTPAGHRVVAEILYTETKGAFRQ